NLQDRKAHPEAASQANRRYRQLHPTYATESRERIIQWRKANPEKAREASRRWKKENPEKNRVNANKHRALKVSAEGSYTNADIDAQYKRQKGRCYYCGCKMVRVANLPNSATVDHVVPLDRGGRNSLDNLVIACKPCNSSKADKMP